MSIIDVHTHMLTRGYLELLSEYGAPQYGQTVNRAGEALIESDGVPFFTLSAAGWDYDRKLADIHGRGPNARRLFNL